MNPSSSIDRQVPVRSQPSGVSVSAVAAALLRIAPSSLCGPRTHSSPLLAGGHVLPCVSGFTIRHSVAGTACPLEPWRTWPATVMWLNRRHLGHPVALDRARAEPRAHRRSPSRGQGGRTRKDLFHGSTRRTGRPSGCLASASANRRHDVKPRRAMLPRSGAGNSSRSKRGMVTSLARLLQEEVHQDRHPVDVEKRGRKGHRRILRRDSPPRPPDWCLTFAHQVAMRQHSTPLGPSRRAAGNRADGTT